MNTIYCAPAGLTTRSQARQDGDKMVIGRLVDLERKAAGKDPERAGKLSKEIIRLIEGKPSIA